MVITVAMRGWEPGSNDKRILLEEEIGMEIGDNRELKAWNSRIRHAREESVGTMTIWRLHEEQHSTKFRGQVQWYNCRC